MTQAGEYIKAEELCYKLNQELKSPIFTVTKLMKMRRAGTIKSHDLRTPGTRQPRYYFKMDEVRDHILSNMTANS